MNVLLYQHEPYHEELAPGFIECFSKVASKITLYLNQDSVRNKGDVLCHLRPIDQEFPIAVKLHQGFKNTPSDIFSEIISNSPDIVVFLTCQSEFVAAIASLTLANGIATLGVVHNVSKAIAQPSVAALYEKNYITPIVLANHIKQRFIDLLPNIKVEPQVIYNVYAPSTRAKFNSDELDAPKPRIAILGAPSTKNFDYHGLIISLANHKNCYGENLQVIVVGSGPDNLEIKNYSVKHNLGNSFKFEAAEFTHRVSYADYYSCLSLCDIVMCLKPAKLGERLVKDRITSSVPAGLSYEKPFLCTAEFASLYGIDGCSVKAPSMEQQLITLSNHVIDPSFLPRLSRVAAATRDRLIAANHLSAKHFLS